MKFYMCPETKTVIEVIEGQQAPLTCDGKPMEELVPNSTNAAVEKHMPVLSIENGELKVCVGEVEHPSIEKHWIPFVAVKAGDLVLRRTIKATEKPEAVFPLGNFKGEVEVYAWCNLQSLLNHKAGRVGKSDSFFIIYLNLNFRTCKLASST